MNLSQETIYRLIKLTSLVAFSASLLMVGKFLVNMKEFRYIGRDVAPQTTIDVTGEGEVFAVPNMAEFTFSVQEDANTVSEAQEAVTARMNAALDHLREAGIDEADTQTVAYNIQPRYEYHRDPIPQDRPGIQPPGREVLVGYRVSHTIRVKVRDTDRAGELLSGLGERRVSNVSGLSFTFADPEETRREARQKAIEQAQTKAEALANDLGVRLVRVVSFSESGSTPPMYRSVGMDMLESADMAPQVPVGESRVVSHVTVTYEIQ